MTAPAPQKSPSQPYTLEQITEFIHQNEKLKEDLRVQVDQLEHKLTRVQAALKESAHLKEESDKALAESVSLFQSEWNNHQAHFPQVTLSILNKAIDELSAKP